MKSTPEPQDPFTLPTGKAEKAPAPDKYVKTDTPGVVKNINTGKVETNRRWNPWTGRWE